MRGRAASAILPALLATLCGCAESPCPEELLAAARDRGVELSCEVLRDPGRLVEHAEAAYDAGDALAAYQALALVHILHPGSAEDPQIFPVASRLFRRFHMRARAQPDSRWVTSEPLFIFGWLESFFQEAGEFPREQVETLFVNLHGGIFREFLVYAKTRPALARWEMVARDDNGIIEAVEGRRAADGAARAGGPE